VRRAGAQHARGQQQRVTREQEADQQAGLEQQDHEDPGDPERREEGAGVEDVHASSIRPRERSWDDSGASGGVTSASPRAAP
jgi:hypothetical protein